MELDPKRRWQLAAHDWLFVPLVIVLAALIAWVAHEYRFEHDLTRTHRNTVSAPTLEALKQLEGPVTVTAFAMTTAARGDDLRRQIEQFLRPYQRAKSDITLTLIDPREQPKAAAAAGVRSATELIVGYKSRTERLTELNEQAFANALIRLARGAERLVLWLDGHGERRLNGNANHDLGEFGRQLQQKGFRLSSLNLAVAQEVPDNAAMLVVATPQVDLLPVETDKISRYLRKGGSMLWLIDPGSLRGMQPIAETLGLVTTPGTVVDPSAARFNAPPLFAIGTAYGRHSITSVLTKNTYFPHARQIGSIESEEWRITPLVETAQRGWVEMGDLDKDIRFDKSRDIPGPINVASAFERTTGGREQRVVVFGSGSFLANSFVGELGNLDLGINAVNWLAGDDRLITIQPRPAPDASLDLSPRTLYLIAFAFLLALPLAFAATGIVTWWRRRSA